MTDGTGAPGAIRFHVAHLSDSDFFDRGLEMARALPQPAVIRTLRGRKMDTYGRAFDEFAAAFQFPYYFGENWPAFDECLSDLGWIEGNAFLTLFGHADDIYKAEPAEYPTMLRQLSGVSRYFAEPVRGQGSADRPAKPFHCTFQCDGSHLIERLLRDGEIPFDIAER